MDFDSLAVRFASVAGIVDTDWLQVAPGIAVLTGRNNVGKSRVMRLVSNLTAAWTNTLQDVPQVMVSRAEYVLTADVRGIPVPREYSVQCQGTTELAIAWSQDSNGWAMSNAAGNNRSKTYHSQPPSRMAEMAGLAESASLRAAITSLAYFPPHRVIETVAPTQPVTVPSPNGSDLGRVIYHHRGNSTPQFLQIQELLCGMLPEIDQVLAAPTGNNQITLQVHDRYADMNIPLADAGTGVGQLLHLIACIILLPPGQTLLIEEPHAYLHPGAEKVLASFFRSHPEHAYVIVSHSPVLINAMEPDRMYLAKRDERGTSITALIADGPIVRNVMLELGIEPSDLALSERVILVEGSADVATYSILLERLGWSLTALGCSVVEMRGSGNMASLQSILTALEKALKIDYLICLDGDQRSDLGSVPNVVYLPETDLEDLLLRDTDAVHLGLQDVLAGSLTSATDQQTAVWPAASIQEFVANYRIRRPGAKGSKIITDLAHEMGIAFRKTVHDPAIAAHVDPSHLGDFKTLFQPLLGLRSQ